MRILLVGEFSSLHKNLKEGLEVLGHQAITASGGDGFKKITSDVQFSSNKKGLIGKIEEKLINPFKVSRKLTNYDVIQLVNPIIFYNKLGINEVVIRYLLRNNHKSFLLAAGCDSNFWTKGRSLLKYGPFEDTLTYDLKVAEHPATSLKEVTWNNKLIRLVDGIIPIMHEYDVSYGHCANKRECIPLPVNTDKILYKENKVGNKLTIFHGLNRYGFKGTRFVEQAFSILRNKYPNDLELIIDGKMPLNEYLQTMNRANVIIDQVNSHSCGMNGLYALAMGKVVLGGSEPESLKVLGVDASPVINVKPDVDHIIAQVEFLLENRTKITDMGFESRIFVEKVHDYRLIAGKYVKTWNQS